MQRTLRIFMCSALPTVPAVHAAQPPAEGGVACTKPMRVAVTYPPGGQTDIVAPLSGKNLQRPAK